MSFQIYVRIRSSLVQLSIKDESQALVFTQPVDCSVNPKLFIRTVNQNFVVTLVTNRTFQKDKDHIKTFQKTFFSINST